MNCNPVLISIIKNVDENDYVSLAFHAILDETGLLDRYKLTEEHIKVLKNIIDYRFVYHFSLFYNELNLISPDNNNCVIQVTGLGLLKKILDCNLDYLLSMKKLDSIVILELPKEEMLQLRLAI